MKLIRLQIEKLFDIFDYDIPIENKDNLLIITGPNGFGKTKILNIIYHFFGKEFEYFDKLLFEKIVLSFDNNTVFEILKIGEAIFIHIKKEHILVSSYENNLQKIEDLLKENNLLQDSFARGVDIHKRIDAIKRSQKNIAQSVFEELLELYESYLKFNSVLENHTSQLSRVHLIEEQRLFRKPQVTEEDYQNGYRDDREMVSTINELARELQSNIESTQKKWLELSQELDSTFPKRLLNGVVQLSEEDFKNRFKQLIEKQNLLKSYHLVETEQEVPDYDPENAKVLSIYLKDSEEKFGVFDILLKKLNLFTTILNKRRFTFKSIKISKTKGFYFETIHKKPLNLTALSSGEQHEIVLLYELIFNAKENMMILIDEPEISLHVTWQKEFVSDLLKIIELQKVQVVIATHSPQIIGNRWDLVCNLVYNLEKRN